MEDPLLYPALILACINYNKLSAEKTAPHNKPLSQVNYKIYVCVYLLVGQIEPKCGTHTEKQILAGRICSHWCSYSLYIMICVGKVCVGTICVNT